MDYIENLVKDIECGVDWNRYPGTEKFAEIDKYLKLRGRYLIFGCLLTIHTHTNGRYPPSEQVSLYTVDNHFNMFVCEINGWTSFPDAYHAFCDIADSKPKPDIIVKYYKYVMHEEAAYLTAVGLNHRAYDHKYLLFANTKQRHVSTINEAVARDNNFIRIRNEFQQGDREREHRYMIDIYTHLCNNRIIEHKIKPVEEYYNRVMNGEVPNQYASALKRSAAYIKELEAKIASIKSLCE